MSNDELQRAIDDITQNGGAGMAVPTTPVMGDNDENEQLAREFGGDDAGDAMGQTGDVAPIAPATPSFATEAPSEPVTTPTMPEAAPVMSQSDFEAPKADAEVMEEAPKFDLPEVEKTEEVEKAAPEVEKGVNADADLEEVKKSALKELYPLLKNMNINPEQAFEICKEVAEMGEKGAFNEAFEAAKKISDDNKRANALFEIVQMIDK